MARPKTPVSQYKKLMLRLPEDLRAECERMAQENERSMNAQIIHTLRESFARAQSHAQHPREAAIA